MAHRTTRATSLVKLYDSEGKLFDSRPVEWEAPTVSFLWKHLEDASIASDAKYDITHITDDEIELMLKGVRNTINILRQNKTGGST